jgi:organic radical activating enzyme
MKHNVDFLDLVIIRSCQLACEGCCTFSDHKKVNGLVDAKDAEPALAFWSQYLNPTRVHLFGGEPTMHPQLLDWFRLARKYWPMTADGKFLMPIWLNTNGYYLDKLFDDIDELFIDNQMFVSVTHHTLEEPYASLVTSNYQKLQDLIFAAAVKRQPNIGLQWVTDTPWDGGDYKKFTVLKDSYDRNHAILNMTFQHSEHFVPHYRGYGTELTPWHDYNDSEAKNINHKACHINNYVQLYKDRLWKCPPRAVLNHTLETYNLQDTPQWAPYYNEYESLSTDASEDAINAWFDRQKTPENTCNMCGFMYSRGNTGIPAQQHLPKKMFKLKPKQ